MPQIHVDSESQNVALCGNDICAGAAKLRQGHSRIGGPSSVTVLTEEQNLGPEEKPHDHAGGTGGLQPGANEPRGSPATLEAGGGRTDPPFRALEMAWPCLHLDLGFWPPELGEI